MDVKNVTVTVFKDRHEVLDAHFISLHKALARIKDGKSKEPCDNIRRMVGEGADKEDIARVKDYLPAVLFSGKFDTEVEVYDNETGEFSHMSKRKDESLTVHSHLITLDFDNLSDANKTKRELSENNFVLACWISPSGNGVKALVKIQDASMHHAHYNAAIAEFSSYGKLDTTSRNPSRICYESYDPEIYVNWDSFVFSQFLEDRKKESSINSLGLISHYDYTKLQVPVRMIELAEDGDKHHRLLKAAHLAGGYVSSGYMDEDVVRLALKKAILERNIDSEYNAIKTIDDGIAHGKMQPIYEFEKAEKEFLKEIGEAQMDFVFDYDKVYLEIEKLLSGEIEQTFTTGYDGLDPHFIWKRSQFIVNLGHSNVGKTYIAMWMAMCTAVLHGWKWIIYSAENKPYTIIRDLMQFASHKRIDEMSLHERKFYKDFVREHFEFIKNDKTYTYYEIIEMAGKIRSRKKFDYILIDPYNALVRKGLTNFGGEHGYDNEAATNMLSYANNSGTGIWLNIHTYTAARREKDADGYSMMPTADKAEGGGKWDNKADFFTISHRIRNHEIRSERFVSMFAVDKVRDMDSGGEPHGFNDPFRMKWTSLDGRYFEDYETKQIPFQPLYKMI